MTSRQRAPTPSGSSVNWDGLTQKVVKPWAICSGSPAPEQVKNAQLLIQDRAARSEGHAERGVLVPAPADRRLHDQAALREQVEGAELADTYISGDLDESLRDDVEWRRTSARCRQSRSTDD